MPRETKLLCREKDEVQRDVLPFVRQPQPTRDPDEGGRQQEDPRFGGTDVPHRAAGGGT